MAIKSRVPQFTLLEFLRERGDASDFAEYETVRSAGPEAMRRTGSLKDFDRPLHEIPFDDPSAAAEYARKLTLHRRLREQLLSHLASGAWVLEACEEVRLEFTPLDHRLLGDASFDFEKDEVEICGRIFRTVIVRRSTPLPLHDQLVSLVREFATLNNPEDAGRPQIKKFLKECLGNDLLDGTLDKAIDAAALPAAWARPGRRSGAKDRNSK